MRDVVFVEAYRDNGKVKQRTLADLGRKDLLVEILPKLQRFLGGDRADAGEAEDPDILDASTWGPVLAVRALMEKSVYDRLELVSGRMAKINKGDVMAGTLGYRRALKGFVGIVPDSIHAGDTIHVLNLGGVLGNNTTRFVFPMGDAWTTSSGRATWTRCGERAGGPASAPRQDRRRGPVPGRRPDDRPVRHALRGEPPGHVPARPA